MDKLRNKYGSSTRESNTKRKDVKGGDATDKGEGYKTEIPSCYKIRPKVKRGPKFDSGDSRSKTPTKHKFYNENNANMSFGSKNKNFSKNYFRVKFLCIRKLFLS